MSDLIEILLWAFKAQYRKENSPKHVLTVEINWRVGSGTICIPVLLWEGLTEKDRKQVIKQEVSKLWTQLNESTLNRADSSRDNDYRRGPRP